MFLMGLLSVLVLAFIVRLLKYKNVSRGLTLITILIFFWAACGFLPETLLSFLQAHPRLEKTTWAKTNAIIVLAGGTTSWEASGLLVPKIEVQTRIYEGLRQYLNCKKSGQVCVVIFSGGLPKNVPSQAFPAPQMAESTVMKNSLMDVGVSADEILTETESTDTEDNARMTAELLKKRTFDSLVLVTSGSHLKRANEWFLHNGLSAELAPADHLRVTSYNLTTRNLALTDVALHEVLGLIEVRIKTLLT